jgi:hypothetical protein
MPINPFLIARIAGALALCGLLMWAGYALRDSSAKADLAECQRTHAEAIAITLRAANKAEAEYRAKEAATAAEHQRITQDANAQTAQARADADRFRAALDRLRKQAAVAPGGSPAASDSGAAPGSPTARAATDLPPDMLWRALEAAGDIAAHADLARIAGQACERSYNALK